MSGNDDQNTQSGGSMADHLKRYRNYIGDLKRGQSSGISAAFGRASDLLPPEVMEIKAPALALNQPPTDKGLTALSPPPLPSSPSAPPAAPPAMTQTATATTAAIGQNVLAADFDRNYLRETVETLIKSYADGLDDPVGTPVRTAGGREEVLAVYIENDERMYMLSDLSVIDEATFRRNMIMPDSQPQNVVEAMPPASTNSAELAVATAEGMMLWQIFYDQAGPRLVSMTDGGVIKRAEGRDQYVFSRLSALDGDIKFYILSGFLVDPSTGNIYIEANEGAYTLALLNNGWQIHQYRNHQGIETFFVSEPIRPGVMPSTYQVRNLELDPATGSVSYETMDSSATIALKSRKL